MNLIIPIRENLEVRTLQASDAQNFFELTKKNNNHLRQWLGWLDDDKTVADTEKYNDIKEALTVLLNAECKDLLPEGVKDFGYPQHQELRNEILKLWKQNPDIDFVWQKLTH